MKTKLFLVLAGMLLLTIGCAPTAFFGVPSKSVNVPEEFGQTETLVQKAEKSPGAQFCPDKVAKAKELGKKGIETYWACRSDEALGLLAKSRKLAEEVMLCKAPPKPMAKPKAVVPPPMPGDRDGDGVPDNKDNCPYTPAGVKVDSVGCPLDSDKDGIYDYKDACPGTPNGASVNAQGCWVLEMVHFDTGKWDIKPQYRTILDEVAIVMRKNPDLKLEVQGHTDSRANERFNQNLSEKRANAVMYYLMRNGAPGIRIISKGYGLTRPIVPNNSPDNMAKNRRVELKPIR